jgi:hypothetical protein
MEVMIPKTFVTYTRQKVKCLVVKSKTLFNLNTKLVWPVPLAQVLTTSSTDFSFQKPGFLEFI